MFKSGLFEYIRYLTKLKGSIIHIITQERGKKSANSQ
jgi:hypothetical protein